MPIKGNIGKKLNHYKNRQWTAVNCDNITFLKGFIRGLFYDDKYPVFFEKKSDREYLLYWRTDYHKKRFDRAWFVKKRRTR